MHFKHMLPKLSIRNKLLLLNIMICLAFLVIAGVVFFSLAVIRDMSTEVTNKDVGRVVSNSQTARELSKLFASIDLLSLTFYGRDDNLKSEDSRLVGIIKDIAESTTVPNLKKLLLALSDHLEFFLSQCAVVNTVLHTRESIDRETHADLTKLEDIISKLLIKLTLEGKDTSFVEQLLSLSTGYHESLLRIGRLYGQLRPEHYFKPLEGKISPVISAIDDLVLRLHTLTASIPEVAKYGKKIVSDLQKYKEAILTFHSEMEKFSSRMKDLNHYKALAISAMENIDNGIYKTTRLVSHSIEKIIFSTGAVVLLLSMVVIVALIFATVYLIRSTIHNPMRSIQKGIESFSKGNFDTKIRLGRKDEWALIEKTLNNMATDLLSSYSALRESEEKYRLLVETMSDGLVIYDQNNLSTYTNDRFCQMLGYSKDEIMGRPAIDFLDDANRNAVEEQIRKRRKGERESYELDWTRKDGQKISTIVSPSPIIDVEDRYAGAFAVVTDISEHKDIQKKLGESVSLLSATFDATADGILVVDSEGKIVSFNKIFVEMWRIPASIVETGEDDQALAFLLDQLKNPESFLKKVKELYSQPDEESFDVLDFKDGRTFERYSQPQRIEGKSVGRVWSFRNVTDRKQAEKALRESEERYRTLMDNLPVAVYRNTPGPKGNFLMANPAFCNMFGFKNEEEVKKVAPADLYVNPKERQQYSDNLIQKGVLKDFERTLLKKDGTPVYTSITSRVVYGKDGEVSYFDSIMLDVTEQKRAKEALRESEEKFKGLFEFAPDAYYLNDLEGYFIDGNKAAEELTGYRKEELIGKNFLELNLLPPEQLPKAAELLEKIIKGQATGPTELILNK